MALTKHGIMQESEFDNFIDMFKVRARRHDFTDSDHTIM